MSVIAFDGKTLAADKRATMADGAIAVTTKIERVGPVLIGTAGNSAVGREMRAWYKAGAIPKDFPSSNRDDRCTLMVVSRQGIDIYNGGPYPVHHENAAEAIGCGADMARAAMACGKTAAEAVAITCTMNAYCGNGVDTLELQA